MPSYVKQIEERIMKVPENQLIVAGEFHRANFGDIPETAYYKTLERLSDSGKLQHLTKGVYYRLKNTRFGIIPISEAEITSHFVADNQGLVIGYRMYNKYGISTQISRQCEILTNAITEDRKNICNVSLRKLGFQLSPERCKTIETLEILQGFSLMEDASEQALVSYVKNFAESYSDTEVNFVLQNRKYKKSTIAFMEYFLNRLSVNNSLGKYLSRMSNYKIPRLEAIL